jgi:hypothetical protein
MKNGYQIKQDMPVTELKIKELIPLMQKRIKDSKKYLGMKRAI